MIPVCLVSRFMLIRGTSVFRVVYGRVMRSAQARRATYAARRGTHPRIHAGFGHALRVG